MKLQHKNILKNGWNEKPFLEKMAHIGSEVYRANKWRNISKSDSDAAFIRSLELIDITKDSGLTFPQLKELCRIREFWVDFYKYDNIYNSTAEFFDKYFMWLTVRNKVGAK